MESKKALRQACLKQAKNLTPAYCQAADAAIVKTVLGLPLIEEASVIFCFVGMPHEIQTHTLLAALLERGKRVCVPRTHSLGEMDAVEIKRLDELAPAGKYGILEPATTCNCLSPSEIEVGIIPCVTADRTGYRLGYGGGFYDRYLQESAMATILLCRSELMVERVPRESHDVAMDMLVTEKDCCRF